MYELSVKDEFCASHIIPGHEGKCKNLHGHTWKVEVCLADDKLNRIGMVVDFRVIKKQLKEFLESIDHTHLNDLSYFQKTPPTTEHIARYIFEGFTNICQPYHLKSVRVWESDSSSITYCPT